MKRQGLFGIPAPAKRVAENHRGTECPMDLNIRCKLRKSGSMLNIRVSTGMDQSPQPQTLMKEARKPPRILSPVVTKQTNLKMSSLLKRKSVSADDIRVRRREIKAMRNSPERKINNFLEIHGYIGQKFKSSITSDEFYKIIEFVYDMIEPDFIKNTKTGHEIIEKLILISKGHPGITTMKKDYLLNPMALHAKEKVLNFVAALCDYVTSELE